MRLVAFMMTASDNIFSGDQPFLFGIEAVYWHGWLHE